MSGRTRLKVPLRGGYCVTAKVGFDRQADAIDAAEYMMDQGRVDPGCHVMPYLCTQCRRWHVGNHRVVFAMTDDETAFVTAVEVHQHELCAAAAEYGTRLWEQVYGALGPARRHCQRLRQRELHLSEGLKAEIGSSLARAQQLLRTQQKAVFE